MRVFICFEGLCESFDVSPVQTVQATKQTVKKNFLVQLPDDKYAWHFLELSYCGATLQDSWALCDVGITGGSTIRCLIKSKPRPVMHVFNAVTGETQSITGSEDIVHMSVARLKTAVSKLSCLPVSAFRLSSSTGVQLYDCNHLQDYDIKVGTTLRLDSWDGWREFIQGCLLGCRLTVQRHLSEEKTVMRFQLRVALYTAASLGHLKLADWLMERGVHTDEPVGVHPYRQWCQQTAHQDIRKCPIHVAAESGQLLILKLFVTSNVLTLSCCDPGGREPLKIAIQHGHRDCVRYLSNKLCSVISLPTLSLPMRIYLQMKRWGSVGHKRVASSQWQGCSASFQARLLLVDGFSQSKMSTEPIKAETKDRGGVRVKAQHFSPSDLTKLTLQPGREIHKRHRNLVKQRRTTVEKIKEGDNTCKLVLPPVSTETYNTLNASLESSLCFGRATRQNAAHCLSIASTFTGKPWSKQLGIARTLIRKHNHSMA